MPRQLVLVGAQNGVLLLEEQWHGPRWQRARYLGTISAVPQRFWVRCAPPRCWRDRDAPWHTGLFYETNLVQDDSIQGSQKGDVVLVDKVELLGEFAAEVPLVKW